MRDHSTIPFRRTGVAALVGVLALFGGALTACGSDDASDNETSDSRATTTTEAASGSEAAQGIADRFTSQTGLEIDDAGALCFGEAMVAGFGEEKAVEVFDSNDELGELPEDDQTIIREAFNDCVPGSAVAEAITTEFYSSAGVTSTPDEAVTTCVAGAIEGRTGDVMWESFVGEATDEVPATTLEALETCVPNTVRAELFAAGMADSGLPPEQLDCIANALAEEFSLADLIEIEDSTTIAPEIEARIEAASMSCV